MKIIKLDGKKMKDRETTHTYLKKKLHLPEYYGNNLDALWDCVNEMDNIRIILKNYAFLQNNLGDYAAELIKIFKERSLTSKSFIFEISK